MVMVTSTHDVGMSVAATGIQLFTSGFVIVSSMKVASPPDKLTGTETTSSL